MASSSTPAQYFPKLLGAVLLAGALSSMLMLVPPPAAAPAPQAVAEVPKDHKTLMRREQPRVVAPPPPRPEAWGRVLRREPTLEAAAGAGAARIVFLGLFGLVALAG